MLYLIVPIILQVVLAEPYNTYRTKIEPFSFDIQKFEYPLEFNKFGTTVALKDTIKLIPKVENRFGALFMSQPVETNQFEIVYNVDVKNDKNTIYKKQ